MLTLKSLFYIIGSLLLYSECILAFDNMCLDSNFESFLDTTQQKHRWVPCEWKKDNKITFLRYDEHIKKSSFDIDFQCLHVSDVICEKAKRTFQKAGELISDVILFKEPIRVNATLASFCKMNNECDNKVMTLGGSSPARAIPLLNDDGLMRLHPQALVKQFKLADHPTFAPFDILSVFNADAPFWFDEDEIPIQSHQADFSFVVLHEFMHGLGFYSGWNEYISPGILTPDPSPFLANQLISMVSPTANALHTTQFLESAMDRLMHIIPPNENTIIPISNVTKELNKVDAGTIAELLDSPNFSSAKEMAFLATHPETLGLMLDQQQVILETSLKPFQPGSSISHVDYKHYTTTPDFLMRFMQDRGVTLKEAIERGGGNSPIGPLLLNVLEEIGYSTVNQPDNIPRLLIYQQPPSNYFQHQRKKLYHPQDDTVSSNSYKYRVSFYSLIPTIISLLFILP